MADLGARKNLEYLVDFFQIVIMSAQKYSVNQQLVETLLTWVKSVKFTPEIQRPFVEAQESEDLMDSLYQDSRRYIITLNPNVRLKDGTYSERRF